MVLQKIRQVYHESMIWIWKKHIYASIHLINILSVHLIFLYQQNQWETVALNKGIVNIKTNYNVHEQEQIFQ